MSIVIECKNKTAALKNPTQPNGEWSSEIQDKILLENGDTIMLKSAFIDTEAASNQKIIIDDDISVEIDHINYVMNNFGVEDGFIDPKGLNDTLPGGTPVADQALNDGLLYLKCNQTSSGTPNLRAFKSLQFKVVDASKPTWGGFNVFINYTDFQGNPEIYKFNVPVFQSNTTKVSPLYDSGVAFLSTGTTTLNCETATGFQIAPSAGGGVPQFKNTALNFLGASPQFPNNVFWSDDIDNLAVLQPIRNSYTFDIPEGNYDPTDLVNYINRELEEVGGNITASNLVDNNFLLSTPNTEDYILVNPIETLVSKNIVDDYRYKYKNGKPSPGGSAPPPAPQITGVYIGASQMTMGWNDATQKFEWQYIHSPYYKDKNESAGYFTAQTNNGTGTPGSVVAKVDRQGGVYITGLRATNKKTGADQSQNFWGRTMGFDIKIGSPTCMLYQYKLELNFDSDELPPPVIRDRVNLFKPVSLGGGGVGIDSTAQYQGIDTAVQKTAQFFATPSLGTAGQPSTGFFSSSDKTIPIEAKTSILANNNSDFGYYLIEVGSNFQTNMITDNENRRTTMAIVSKYYVKDSYTSGDESSSLLYTHQGEPMILSAFRCRILDSDKNLAENIGVDNTIFLEIVKNTSLNKST